MGDIANMYGTDCFMIQNAAMNIHNLWATPLQIIIASVMLYRLLGVSALAGFVVIGLSFAVNHYRSQRYMTLYTEAMECKDQRMKIVSEAFKAISIVKFNAWEERFLERIGASRAVELAKTWQLMSFNAGTSMFSWGLPVFVSVATFSVYTGVMHQQLTPTVVFTSIALFEIVQMPKRYIGSTLAAVIQAFVAAQRIAEFLQLAEIQSNDTLSIHSPEADQYIANNVIVAVENGAFAWDHESPLLKNINLQVNVGEFVVVHGPVGSGKSSLCSALLGDMIKTNGQVYVGGSVAYCSQQPWIQHATVRDNILFGRAFDRKKYEKVIDACALTTDLQSLPAGDRTEIGERGVNLSGGQKARVALARACYSDASVYILDAPLSAVDAIVQNEIFQKCLLGLLRHRTIVLVTHNPEIIASEHVTRAVTISESGELVETRSLVGDRPAYTPLVTPLASRDYVKTYDECDVAASTSADQTIQFASTPKSPLMKHSSSFDVPESPVADKATSSKETHRLVQDEKRELGRVGLHVFSAYYRAVGGFAPVLLLVLSQMLWQGLQIASDFWLSDWSSDVAAAASRHEEAQSTGYRNGVYAAVGLTAAFMVLVRTITTSYFGLRAARRMFDQMTQAIMYAPMKFFDSNPIGRILSRYSTDVANVDFTVPETFSDFLANLFSAGCTLATAAVIIRTNGLLLVPVIAVYIRLASFYVEPAREIERLLRTSFSPLFNHLSESIEGGAVIRAYGAEALSRFEAINNGKLDDTNKVFFAYLAVMNWFSQRVQTLSSALIFIVAFSLVLLHSELPPALTGLAFSYVLKVSMSMEHIVQSWSSVETTMISPERIQEYIDVEQEAPHKIPTMDPPASSHWPTTGAIQFNSVSFRYKDTDKLVLKNLNFFVTGGEKIGIVGRTGAGKSSLTMALFRINELAGGSITIDGVDVSKIGLKTLREKLSIIPQNPVLFKGPLRKYLDPFDEYSDDQLWDCIRRVGLSERISGEDDKLEYFFF